MPHPWSVQGQDDKVFEQPGLVKDGPAHEMWFGLHDLYRFLPTQTIPWFYNLSSITCVSQAGLIAFSSGQFSFESHKKDTMTLDSLWRKSKLLMQRKDYHTRQIIYILSYQELLREPNVFFWSAPVTKLKVSHLFFVSLLYQDCSFYHFQITYRSFLNKEPQSKPQACVLSNQHFDKISRSLSVLFICLRLL